MNTPALTREVLTPAETRRVTRAIWLSGLKSFTTLITLLGVLGFVVFVHVVDSADTPAQRAPGSCARDMYVSAIAADGSVTCERIAETWELPSEPLATVPTLIPSRTDVTTGIGAHAVGDVSLIASGVEALAIKEHSATFTVPVRAGRLDVDELYVHGKRVDLEAHFVGRSAISAP